MFKKVMRNKPLIILGLITLVALLALGITASAQQISGSKMRLLKGWNLISVTLPMQGKAINQFSDAGRFNDECNITTSWIFHIDEETINPWLSVKPSKVSDFTRVFDIESFSAENVGHGMWVLANEKQQRAGKDCFIKCGISSCAR